MKASIAKDYLSASENLRSFYGYQHKADNYEAMIMGRSTLPVNRALLCTTLRNQYAELSKQYAAPGLNPAVTQNIELLAAENTFTLTTGHQLVLAGGPMYLIYKIVTVITLAERLRKQIPGFNFVPVFWLASEDHDFAEVNHYYTDFEKKITYPAQFDGPVGRHILETSIADVIPNNLKDWMSKFFVPGKTLAAAYRAMIDALFGSHGLVILDGDDAGLKAAFSSHITKELSQKGIFSQVETTSRRLESLGYAAQVIPHPINLFYLGAGGRQRIDPSPNGFALQGSDLQFSPTEMAKMLAENPEDFSPNAILRPLYQEFTLPNLAYAGGWGELAYWLQLKDAFTEAGISYPILVPRMSATIFAGDDAKNWQELGFTLPEIEKENAQLANDYLDRIWDDSPFFQKKVGIFNGFNTLETWLKTQDPTLAQSLAAQEAQTVKFLENLHKKLRKAIRNKNPKPFEAISVIKNRVQPDHFLQERTLNFSAFCKGDPVDLINKLLKNCDAFETGRKYLLLD